MQFVRVIQLGEKIRDTLRHEGFLIVLWRVLVKFLSPVGSVGMATLYEKDLTRPIVEVNAKVDVTVTEAAGSDIVRVVELMAWHAYGSAEAVAETDKGVQELLGRGARCFVAKIGDEIVHYNWLAFQWAESLPISSGGRFIVLENDEAFCMNAYTVPPWRGRAIHTAVLHTMLLWLRRAGVRKAYTVVSNDNKSSWKTHERLGWGVRGTMLYFKRRGKDGAWVWGTRGILRRFVAEEIPRRS